MDSWLLSGLSGEDLVKLRDNMGVSARTLAEHVGIGFAQWGHYERGTDRMSREETERLHISLPVEDILAGRWEKPAVRLRRLREGLGHSQEDLAAILHLATGEIAHIERGDYRLTRRMAERVAECCGTSADWLLFAVPIQSSAARRRQWAGQRKTAAERARQRREQAC